MKKTAVIFRFALVVAVIIGGIQAGTAAIDSIQNSAAQHRTALERTGL
jgi:hypothetical protein